MASHGGKLVVDSLTLDSRTAYDLKDFTIGCDVKGNSRSTIESMKAILYETVKADQKRTFPEVRFENFPLLGASVDCRVIDARHIW